MWTNGAEPTALWRARARANWKLLVENSIDFYHTVPLHKTYFKFLKDFGTDLSSGVSGRGNRRP